MKKILPVLLAVIGIGAGVGAGVVLRPTHEEVVALNPCGESQVAEGNHTKDTHETDPNTREYVKLNNQFVVPIVSDEKVTAMVVMSLSVEVGPGQKEVVYEREPKLRDSFLQVLFDHANMGGFRGAFTNSNNMDILRDALKEVAVKVMGDAISDVLIMDIARQDI